MAENFLNLRKRTGYPDQEAQGAQNKMNPKIPTEIYHKWQREMQRVPKKGSLIRLSAHISAETFQARMEWHIFKVVKGKTQDALPSKVIIQN